MPSGGGGRWRGPAEGPRGGHVGGAASDGTGVCPLFLFSAGPASTPVTRDRGGGFASGGRTPPLGGSRRAPSAVTLAAGAPRGRRPTACGGRPPHTRARRRWTRGRGRAGVSRGPAGGIPRPPNGGGGWRGWGAVGGACAALPCARGVRRAQGSCGRRMRAK
ncbi:hypothetical protein BU14_0215s0025 [Porphyra umbilicalis]|uniref:Uncharacterized protein n=1 Tax=Porphyra umbilicalis TaxID=2786 RepID=A0A1X6P541_PORUM|nr:hypothetical protein BU14_0215s0025 [Porphyra umbilicalis]|eukprot:OSX75964.1 hypothetical protein BU14_0215s0025 [Porphyra umbilicalis]